mmetsp:Transcript_22993/g.74933  ORF Transcript_22993/g.74933 Transcript_22993/m.74933 type:complete len:279 (-) Transcript_22993:98-934(-)
MSIIRAKLRGGASSLLLLRLSVLLPARRLALEHLFRLCNDVVRGVEDAVRGLVAHVARLRLGVVPEAALLAKVVAALGHDRVLHLDKLTLADVARERELVLVLLPFLLALLPARPPQLTLLPQLLLLLPLLVQLPPHLVIAAVVHKLARVPKAAVPRVLVVFANVGFVIHDEREADVGRRAQRPVRAPTLLRSDGVLAAEALAVVDVRVHAAVLAVVRRRVLPSTRRRRLLQNLLAQRPPIVVVRSLALEKRGRAHVRPLLHCPVRLEGKRPRLLESL